MRIFCDVLTSVSGGDGGGFFCACLTTKLFRRISVPGGGPSTKMKDFETAPLMRNFPCNCTQSLSDACNLDDDKMFFELEHPLLAKSELEILRCSTTREDRIDTYLATLMYCSRPFGA